MLRKARVRDRERRQQLLGTGVRGSTISDRKGGWGATRGYPRLTPGTRANRLFEIALLDAIESLHSHSDLLRQMERGPISSRAIRRTSTFVNASAYAGSAEFVLSDQDVLGRTRRFSTVGDAIASRGVV